MSFSAFQTDTGTLKKMGTDGFNKPTELDAIFVNVDPQLGYKRINTAQNEEITGRTTIIDTNDDSLHEFWDESHDNYILNFRGKDWQIEQADPFQAIGSNKIQHIEISLR